MTEYTATREEDAPSSSSNRIRIFYWMIAPRIGIIDRRSFLNLNYYAPFLSLNWFGGQHRLCLRGGILTLLRFGLWFCGVIGASAT